MSDVAIRANDLGVAFDLSLTGYRTLRKTVASLRRGLPRRLGKERFWALRNVDFTVESGEVLGVIGENGSGKSSLLLVIAGVLRPDEGTIEAYGRPTMLSLGAGFEEDLTGRENVYLNAAFLGFTRKATSRYMDRIVEFSELGSFIDVPLRKYSTGMRSRLGFSIAAHIEPEILLLDEIFAVGDAHFQRKSADKIQELMSQARAIVVVTHDMEFVRQSCTKALWLERGAVAGFGDPNAVVGAYLDQVDAPTQFESAEVTAGA
jgi:teichoic acid transport system ATP-binding protein